MDSYDIDDAVQKKLIENDDDVAGILAYGMYKYRQVELIAEISKDRGRPPTATEIEHVFDAGRTDATLADIKSAAESALLRFAFSIHESIQEDTSGRPAPQGSSRCPS